MLKEIMARIAGIVVIIIIAIIVNFVLKRIPNGIVKECAVREYPKSWIGRYQAA